MIPRVNSAASKALSARKYTDAPFRVFTSPRRVRFKEQEYAIPAEHLVAVLGEIRALFARKDWRISFPIEVRLAPADQPWLSTAHGRDSAYIAIHVFHASPHAEYFAEVESIMTAIGGRPHWGKMHTRDAEYLRGVYPKFDEFVALRAAIDPTVASATTTSSRYSGPSSFSLGPGLVARDVRPHHLVVFVVEDVAVHHVGRALSRVEGVQVLAGLDGADGDGLRGPADGEPVDEAGERLDGVLPAGLVGVRRDRRPAEERAEGRVAADRAVGVRGEVVLGRAVAGDDRARVVDDRTPRCRRRLRR